MSKKKKVFHYTKEDDHYFPKAIYDSIVDAARESNFERTTLSYHLNRYGYCEFILGNDKELHVLSLRSLIVPDSIEPIKVIIESDTDEELHESLLKVPSKPTKTNLLTKVKRLLSFW